MSLSIEKTRKFLAEFKFQELFINELGWSQPTSRRTDTGQVDDCTYSRRMIAQLAGVAVFEIWSETASVPDRKTRDSIERQVAVEYRENLCIFLDCGRAKSREPSQSFWVWAKRGRNAEGKPERRVREHTYFRGQPADLFISKLQALFFELSEVSDEGNLTVVEVARRLLSALDVEKTTKRFYIDYQQQHLALIELISGIDNERDRRWYASVILNRLMFAWFMQKKGFLDGGDFEYLIQKFELSKTRGTDRFFGEFLNILFFEAFAKPEDARSDLARSLSGKVPYLNGGLFLHHKLELDADGSPRVGTTLRIPDRAFDGIFRLFSSYTWNLDDTPGGKSDEINPDVLGYIFEKYINQKAFGAYYTRPEITSYLADRSIHSLILERIREPAIPELNYAAVEFESVADMLARMDSRIAIKLVKQVLPSLSILDPAVGSGAFLVAALKTLVNVYSAVVGRAEMGASEELQSWLRGIQQVHPSVGYYIKRQIVTDNLYGVDIMEEACEIAKLRLFLAMVSSVSKVDDLEPLPNIDFNILPGNSLVGLMRVDEHEFNNHQPDLFKPQYRQLVDEKNRKLAMYRNTATDLGKTTDLLTLRDDIDKSMTQAEQIMNELLRDQFETLGVKFEQATWDDRKKVLGKPTKRQIARADIDAQTPFHWGYVFDRIIQIDGGFDIVITNPPWEVFKPQAKEFFADHSELVTKNKMTIKEFETEQSKLLKDDEVREAWLEYESTFPHMSSYFRAAPEYCHQSAIVGGKRTGSDLNLYKLFTERCFRLVRPGGHVGIVNPSGIYTDLGAKGLRDLLFKETHIEGLFCFENRKAIFEGVDSRFKFVVLTFEKSVVPRVQSNGERNVSAPPDDLLAPARLRAIGTQRFPAAFMRLDVAELSRFPDEGGLWLDVELIRKLSPDSHSLMEFKSELDIHIAEKMLKFPLLGEAIVNCWNLKLATEFHMTNDSRLFETAPKVGRLPLYEGKMVWQFDSAYAKPRYWVEERAGRKSLIGRGTDRKQKLDYQTFRLGFRDIARNTDTRTLICSVIPPAFHGNKLPTLKVYEEDGEEMISPSEQLFLCAIWNSFVIDWFLRQKVTTTINFFYLYQLPVPRLRSSDKLVKELSRLSAKLICTSPEFDKLAIDAGLRDHGEGLRDSAERIGCRAKIDGLVAHLYGITESELVHILATFPLVPEPEKVATRNAFRDIERGLIS